MKYWILVSVGLFLMQSWLLASQSLKTYADAFAGYCKKQEAEHARLIAEEHKIDAESAMPAFQIVQWLNECRSFTDDSTVQPNTGFRCKRSVIRSSLKPYSNPQSNFTENALLKHEEDMRRNVSTPPPLHRSVDDCSALSRLPKNKGCLSRQQRDKGARIPIPISEL